MAFWNPENPLPDPPPPSKVQKPENPLFGVQNPENPQNPEIDKSREFGGAKPRSGAVWRDLKGFWPALEWREGAEPFGISGGGTVERSGVGLSGGWAVEWSGGAKPRSGTPPPNLPKGPRSGAEPFHLPKCRKAERPDAAEGWPKSLERTPTAE